MDTNIWLHAFVVGSDPDKSSTAQSILRRETDIVVSTQVLSEIAVNLIKKAAFAESDVRALIASFYRRYPIVELDQAILMRASELRERYQISLWDSLIVASAWAAGSPVVYSEDMDEGLVVDKRLTIVNPLRSSPSSG
jgi:predicted nucleic acid-binding protein